MKLSRRGFLKALGLLGLGYLLPKGEQGLPDTLLGFPIKWVDEPTPQIKLAPMSSGEAELMARKKEVWEAWKNLELRCTRCNAMTAFAQVMLHSSLFGSVIYECPKCGWQIDMAIGLWEIPEEELC